MGRRALAYDADDAQGWQVLRQAARALAVTGFQPLLEPSPRGRGGHLWLIFTALVDAQAARQHAHSIASELAEIAEYWPGPPGVTGWNRVRLPAGRYIAKGMSAWCHLYDADGHLLARDGMSAVRVLLAQQTPAELMPSLPPDQPRACDPSPPVTNRWPARSRDSRPAVTQQGQGRNVMARRYEMRQPRPRRIAFSGSDIAQRSLPSGSTAGTP